MLIATEDDLEALLSLEKACFTSDQLSRHAFSRLLNRTGARIYIEKKGDQIIASAVLLFRKNSKCARLYSFAVSPLLQQKGLGKIFLSQIEAELAKICEEIRLEVRTDNNKAISFYQKFGYVTFAKQENFYEDGETAFKMKKNIRCKVKQNEIEKA
ncbi:MAG: GNAT family N-acetyltransferase [Gammaproteobacteria bacterium]|nr:GNAT family N-acetyltransferase [Gammaproteobacteria bacterium]